MQNSISINRPDDWHVHVRDGAALRTTVPHLAARYARAIIMPNLKPPVTTTRQALDYYQRVIEAIPQGSDFTPLMTLYLTDATTAREIETAHDSGKVYAVKLYPAGATTHSDAGVTDIANTWPALEAMEKHGMPLLIHGEVTDSETDIFDREKVFIERHLVPLRERFPALRIVLEHITTRDAVDYISACPDNVAATITPQHLLLNRNALLVGGIRPHNYCLPVLKRETHRQALVAAATGESGKFFLGSDTAPHNRAAKESACGCAGIYSAHASLELYTEVFDQAGALDRLNAFASERGAAFYRLPVNTETVTLVRESWTVPDYYDYEGEMLVPFRAGQQIHWRLQQ